MPGELAADTDALSELTKPKPFDGLVDWLEIHEAETALSAISIGEMVAGLNKCPKANVAGRWNGTEIFARRLRRKNPDFTEGAAVEWQLLGRRKKQWTQFVCPR